VPVDGGGERRLAEGHAPAAAPGGSRVAYLKDSAVWIVRLDSSGAAPERLFTARGRASDLRWSPSGDRLAFVSRRGDHSFVGVYAPAADTLAYLSPSVARDSDPVWGPDGRRIAFLRRPHERADPPYSPDRTGLPWSIRVADLDAGTTEAVWTAPEGTGSAYEGIRADNQILWAAGDRIVFPWERTGWVHLYAVPAGGGRATDLTPGEHRVQFVEQTPDREAVVYASNRGDPERRHLWRVGVDGGAPERLTGGAGIEWAPAVTAASGAVAFLASGARTPAHAGVLPPDGERRPMARETMPEAFPGGRLVEPRSVTFPATDGKTVHGQLFLPPGAEAGDERPAVLFFHGGPRRQMLLGFHYRHYYHNAYALNQALASRGYVVLSVNYRGGIGYGLEVREARDYGPRGASEYRDALGAGLYLKSRPEVDGERIGLWGGSYGGYLTALGLARDSDLFAAGVDLHGVHDWNALYDDYVEPYAPDRERRLRRIAWEASPMADVESWRSPVLLIHGDDDRNVPFSETVNLVEALRRQGVPHETLVFPDEVHGFLLHESWVRAYRAALDFFDRTLSASDGGSSVSGAP
jgi:dipeptidyl aminopeptidase/acylaminoacyl peptidase